MELTHSHARVKIIDYELRCVTFKLESDNLLRAGWRQWDGKTAIWQEPAQGGAVICHEQ